MEYKNVLLPKQDLQNALQELSSLNNSTNANSIKDIFRLGKFKKDQNRPRPLLIKLLCATDAFSVLANGTFQCIYPEPVNGKTLVQVQ